MPKNLVAVVIFLLLPWFAQAVSVYVSPVEGQALSEAEKQTLHELLKIAVGKVSSHQVTELSSDADATLFPRALKLGNSLIVAVRKQTKAGRSFEADMKAERVDELDVVANRLVRAVLSESSVRESVRISDVTEKEQKQAARRIEPTRNWVFGLGPGWATSLNDSRIGVAYSLGFAWGLDPNFDLSLSYNGFVSEAHSASRFGGLAIGGTYLFSEERHSPFVTGDFGYGSARANAPDCRRNFVLTTCPSEDHGRGWILGAGLGYRFYRTSSVHLGLVFHHSVLMASVNGKHPQVSALRVQIYW